MGRRIAFISWLILLAGVVVGWEGHGPIAESKLDEPAGLNLKVGSEPIRVSAETLVWDHKGHRATFHQEVVARQTDLTIYCDDLIIYFNEDDSDVTRLVAKGNVRITQMDRRASCEEAMYDRSQNRIVLEGNPVIRQGENEVRGKRVTFFLNEERSIVESGPGDRVKVTLVPEQEEPGDKL